MISCLIILLLFCKMHVIIRSCLLRYSVQMVLHMYMGNQHRTIQQHCRVMLSLCPFLEWLLITNTAVALTYPMTTNVMVYLKQPSLNREVVDNQPSQSLNQLLQAKDLVHTRWCGQASILE